MKYTFKLFICLLTHIAATSTLEITVCDCKAAKSRGILDIDKPYYCQPGLTNLNYTIISTTYQLITLQKPTITWKGYSCQQWIKRKTVIGSFWIGSFDTTYAQETKLVNTTDCWNMVLNRKCGDHVMQSSGTSSSFIATPIGEGAWYDTKNYEIINCLVEEITLRQYASEDLIESPFGMLNATPTDKQFIHNHNTIVWGELKSNSSGSTTLFQGSGNVELTEITPSNNISRLIDSNRQVEITFYSIGDHKIKFIPGPVFPVVGMPKTFLVFPHNTANLIYKNFQKPLLECAKNNQTDFCINLVKYDNWYKDREDKTDVRKTRSITQEVQFLLNNQEEDVEAEKRLYSLSYAWGTLRLGHPRIIVTGLDSTEVTVFLTHKEEDMTIQALLYNQMHSDDFLPEERNFEYLVDNSIRIQQTEHCLTAANNSYVYFQDCQENPQQWIFDLDTNQIISVEAGSCLTALDLLEKSEMILILLPCTKGEKINKAQQWVFEKFNTNPEITELFPDANLEEMKEFKQEQLRAVTTTINSPIFGGNLNINQGTGNIVWDMISWGLFKCLRNKKCVTHHGIGAKLTMESCDENWTACQENLHKLITSNDQLVQTQTAVANCSQTFNNGQAFEYSSDFTIRAFNTNNCVKANGSMVILEKCANTSSFWATFDHTAQFMAADRTGLQKVENKRCLQLSLAGLSLNVCGKDREGHKRQQFVFDHHNPYHTKRLSAANIIEWYANRPIDKKRSSSFKIPPLKDRDFENKVVADNLLNAENKNPNRPTVHSISEITSNKSQIAKVGENQNVFTPASSIESSKTSLDPENVLNPVERSAMEKIHTIIDTITVTLSPKTLTLTTTITDFRENIVSTVKYITVENIVTFTSKLTVTKPASTVTQMTTVSAPQVTKLVTVAVTPKTTDEKGTKTKPIILPSVTKSVTSNNTDQVMLNDSDHDSQQASKILSKNIADFDEKIKYQIDLFHEQFKLKIETEHENKLAREIRDVYCQLTVLKRNQAISLAQTNGILAAATLGLPICSRLQGIGQTMILQECETKIITSLSAKETKCGFQPFFGYGEKNFTVGTDGYSMHPFSECFWTSTFVNLNGKPYSWEHQNTTNGDWIKQIPSIKAEQLSLIAEFDELKLNDFDLELKGHAAHDIMEMEQLNILNDFTGRLYEDESLSKEVNHILLTNDHRINIGRIYSWFDILKIMVLATIGIILLVIIIKTALCCNIIPAIRKTMKKKPKTKKKKKAKIEVEEDRNNMEMENMLPRDIENIYNAPSVKESIFIRDYAPLPLTSQINVKGATAQLEPTAPSMHTLSSLYTVDEQAENARSQIQSKIYPSLTSKLTNLLPHIKFHHKDEKLKNKNCTGSHTTCSYVAGHGMVWEDLCKCSADEDLGVKPKNLI